MTLQRTVSDLPFRRPSGRGCAGDRWVAHLLGAPKWEYHYERKVVLGSEDHAHLAMPRVHRVTSLLDRWWLGTYWGANRPQQLDYFLDEFIFRFN